MRNVLTLTSSMISISPTVHVKSAENAKPADDAAEIMWIPWEEIKPETFGLTSIRKGVQQLLAKKIHNI